MYINLHRLGGSILIVTGIMDNALSDIQVSLDTESAFLLCLICGG